jgi:hypothetical protein
MSGEQKEVEVPNAAGEAEEYLAETEAIKQKVKEVKKTSEVKIQLKSETPRIKLPFKESPKLYSTRVVPQLSPCLTLFARPRPLPTKKMLTTPIVPHIPISTAGGEEECRIQILEPLTIHIPNLHPPRLTLELPIDISIRPLFQPHPIKSLNIIQPKLKLPPPLLPHLIPLPAPPVKLTSLYVPKLPVISPHVQKEEKVPSMIVERKERQQEAVVKAELTTEQRTEEVSGVGGGGTEELLDKLFPPIRGEGICKWDHKRPICFVVTGESFDGKEMLEDIISTKYTFHGEYTFSRNLPWQVKTTSQQRVRNAEEVIEERMREKPSIYEKIVSKDLIVSEKVTENDKGDIIKGLRDIANRGPKCVILYTDKLEPLQYLDKEVGACIEVKFIRLPTYSDKTLHLIGELIGVEPKTSSPSIKVAWVDSLRYCEKVMEKLDQKLKYKSN